MKPFTPLFRFVDYIIYDVADAPSGGVMRAAMKDNPNSNK
jgi:hypothetical protein